MANRGESRVTPDVARNFNLSPAASVVDKQGKYNPQLEDAAKLKATADGLVKLAKGLSDVDALMQRQARDNALQEYATKTGDETKKKWADVSHNIKGMAKFNPYNEDAYNALVCNDIGKKYINDLYADPELKYRDPQEVDNMINNLQTDMIAEFGKTGLAQRYYAKSLLDFKKHSDNLVLKHTSEHAEVKMQRTDNQISTSYSNVLLEGGEAEFTNTLDTVVLEGKGLGRSLEGNANNVINTVRKAVATNPSKYSTAFVLGQLRDYKIDGKTLTEIVPALEDNVLKMMREVKTAEYQDLKIQLEHDNLQGQLAINDATNEWCDWLNQNPHASQKEKETQFNLLVDKYELHRFQIGFANGISGYQSDLFSLTDVKTDPEVFEELRNKANQGELSVEDMNSNTRYLSNAAWKQLNEQITKDTSSTIQYHTKQFNELYLKDDSPTRLRGNLYNKAKVDLNNLNEELNNKLITPAEYKRRLNLMEDEIKHQQNRDKNMAQNVKILSDATYRNSLRLAPETEAKAEANFSKFGMIRNSDGVPRQNVDVLSMPAQNRDGRIHVGYDINNVAIGQPIYPPKGLSGTVVCIDSNATMGNYIILKLKNNKYCLIQHLNDFAGLKYNDKFGGNDVIGHVGNTGRAASNGSLHIEFWDKNCQWINTTQF